MGEVGVNPDRVAQAATALEQLRDALAANVPIIMNTLNQYWSGGAGSPVNLRVLSQAVGRAPGDAADMRTRARLAALWEQQKVGLTGNGLVDIPFSGSALDSAVAHADAQALAAAESNGNPKAARAAIQAIQLDIQDHVDEGNPGTAWLKQFYNDAAPQVANLALTLHGQDGQGMTVLTTQDQQILNTYAQGLAAVDKAGGLSPATISAFSTKAKNLWSVGMLFKFGPSGSAYGAQEAQGQENLVAQVTQAIELGRMRGGYTIPLAGSDVSTGAWGADEVTQVLQQFDPAQALLTLATQNGAAAREVMAGPQGQQIASDLMDRPVTQFYPTFGSNGSGSLQGFMPIAAPKPYFDGKLLDYSAPLYAMSHPLIMPPNVVGSFFDAATAAPRGTDAAAYDSAMAAMHLIDATPAANGSNGIQLPEPVRAALLHTAQRYLYDLAQSTVQTGPSQVLPLFDKQGNAWSVYIRGEKAGGGTPLSAFLQQIVSNPADAGVLQASVKTALGQYYAISVTSGFPPPLNNAPADQQMASLLGRVQTETGNFNFQGAQKTDQQNAEYNALLAFGEGQAKNIPVIGSALGDAQTAAGLLGINMPQFSTNNAAVTAQTDAQNFAIEETRINVPMVQALISNGTIPASSLQGQHWFQNGHIVITGENATSFNAWYQGNSTIKGLQDHEDTYQHVMQLQQSTSSQSGG
jgi:hypothetical protein